MQRAVSATYSEFERLEGAQIPIFITRILVDFDQSIHLRDSRRAPTHGVSQLDEHQSCTVADVLRSLDRDRNDYRSDRSGDRFVRGLGDGAVDRYNGPADARRRPGSAGFGGGADCCSVVWAGQWPAYRKRRDFAVSRDAWHDVGRARHSHRPDHGPIHLVSKRGSLVHAVWKDSNSTFNSAASAMDFPPSC